MALSVKTAAFGCFIIYIVVKMWRLKGFALVVAAIVALRRPGIREDGVLSGFSSLIDLLEMPETQGVGSQLLVPCLGFEPRLANVWLPLPAAKTKERERRKKMTLLWSSYFSFLVLVFVSNVVHFPVVKMFCLLKNKKMNQLNQSLHHLTFCWTWHGCRKINGFKVPSHCLLWTPTQKRKHLID